MVEREIKMRLCDSYKQNKTEFEIKPLYGFKGVTSNQALIRKYLF